MHETGATAAKIPVEAKSAGGSTSSGGAVFALQRTAGNRAVARALQAGAIPHVQRQYTMTPAETISLRQLVETKWPQYKSPFGADGRPDHTKVDQVLGQLAGWCKSDKQAQSIVANMTADEFWALKNKKGLPELPTKAADIRTFLKKHLAAELKAIEDKKILDEQARVDNYRLTGKGIPGAEAMTKGLVTFEHRKTHRTFDEKAQKSGSSDGPFMRMYRVKVQGKAAGWDLHVHYRGTATKEQAVLADKAHTKLLNGPEHEHIHDLNSTHAFVVAVLKTVDKSFDSVLPDLAKLT